MQRAPNIQHVARHTRNQLFGVGGIADDIKARWDALVADFQAKRAQLDQAEVDLWEVEPETRGDQADAEGWMNALNKIQLAKGAMDAVAGAISGASDMWQSTKSFFGLSGRRGMGLLPALPLSLGALAALTVAATAAISTTYAFIAYINSKTDRYSQLVAAGVDPVTASREATKDAEQTAGYSLPATIQRTSMWIVLGLGIVFIAPKVLKK